jgi:hemolysin III
MDLEVKPRLRGVLHQYAFFVALAAGGILLALSPTLRTRLAVAVYALALAACFAASAAYHRIEWSPRVRPWMRRLDHSMIFVLIAGTYTPFALVTFSRRLAIAILVVAWGGALVGLAFNLLWIDAPRGIVALLYIALGWVGVVAVPQMLDRAGTAATVLVGIGGLLYTGGAITYALKRPDPWPRVFGFHEVFHTAVIAAAAVQFAAVAVVVDRAAG